MSGRLMILIMTLALVYYSSACAQQESRHEITSQDHLRVTVVDGLLSYLYQVEEATSAGELVHLLYDQHELILEGFPSSAEDYHKTDVIILANVGIRLLTEQQLQLLKDAIAGGTGLMILGGKIAYGASGIHGSVLDEVLPVQINAALADLEREDGILQITKRQVVGELSLPTNLVSPFVHRVHVRPEGDVQITVGSKPFLVTGGYGKGRVVCLTGTLHGTAPAGMQLFYEWSSWPQLMRNSLQWLAEPSK